jgi:hypothetical protein
LVVQEFGNLFCYQVVAVSAKVIVFRRKSNVVIIEISKFGGEVQVCTVVFFRNTFKEVPTNFLGWTVVRVRFGLRNVNE